MYWTATVAATLVSPPKAAATATAAHPSTNLPLVQYRSISDRPCDMSKDPDGPTTTHTAATTEKISISGTASDHCRPKTVGTATGEHTTMPAMMGRIIALINLRPRQ